MFCLQKNDYFIFSPFFSNLQQFLPTFHTALSADNLPLYFIEKNVNHRKFLCFLPSNLSTYLHISTINSNILCSHPLSFYSIWKLSVPSKDEHLPFCSEAYPYWPFSKSDDCNNRQFLLYHYVFYFPADYSQK